MLQKSLEMHEDWLKRNILQSDLTVHTDLRENLTHSQIRKKIFSHKNAGRSTIINVIQTTIVLTQL